MLDRNSCQPIGKFARNRVRCGDTRLLRSQSSERLAGRYPEVRRILGGIVGKGFIVRQDGLRGRRAFKSQQQNEQQPSHPAHFIPMLFASRKEDPWPRPPKPPSIYRPQRKTSSRLWLPISAKRNVTC